MKRIDIKKISFNNLCLKKSEVETSLNGLSCEFLPSSAIHIQGPVGSGKSTLLKVMVGLEKPHHGDYLINEQSLRGLSYKEFDAYRLNMGIALRQPALMNNMSLFENLKLPLDFHSLLSGPEKNDFILNLFTKFGLQNQMHLRPMFATAAARKAVGVMRAFVLKPQVILLSNPTHGLQLEHVEALVDLLKMSRSQFDLKYIFMDSDDEQFNQKLAPTVLDLTIQKMRKQETDGLINGI